MLLRSSSTPILGSLLSSYSEKDFENIKNPNSDHHHHIKKISFSHGSNLNFTSFSCNSSNSISGFSDSDQDFSSRGVFRRVQSDGNLEGLVVKSCDDIEEFRNSKLPPLRRSSSSMLQTVPSFAIFNSISGFEEDEEEEEEERESGFNVKDGVLGLGRSITIGDNIMAIGNDGFSFGESKMGLIEEDERMNNFQYLGVDEDGQPMSPPMFLARGLGMDFGGGGGGGDFNPMKLGEGVQDEANSGEYYKKMVEENPCSPLVLRNYAQFLYKTKGDLRGAEEYYSRAILADPQDGEILSQYAKLVWELHHDHELASSYYERSVQASPQDCHVHAAYASFLWETEEEEQEQDSLLPQSLLGIATFHEGAMASATA